MKTYLIIFKYKWTEKMQNKYRLVLDKISADADGGPRSRVCSRDTPAQPPINVSGNFSAHVSAE